MGCHAVRLLYVANDFDLDPSAACGAARRLRGLSDGLADLGHEVILLSPLPIDRASAVHRLLPAGCPPAEQLCGLLTPYLSGCGLADRLTAPIRPLMYSAWAGRAALAALSDTPIDAVVEHYAPLSHVGIDLAAALDVPLLVDAAAPLRGARSVDLSSPLGELASAIDRRLLTRADVILASSASQAGGLVGCGASADRIQLAPGGVDGAGRAGRRKPALPRAGGDGADPFVVAWIVPFDSPGTFERLRSTWTELLARHRRTRPLVIAAPSAHEGLRDSARHDGFDEAVTVSDASPDDERFGELLNGVDAAVVDAPPDDLPNLDPQILLDCLASGACTLAPRVESVEELISDGSTGLLFNAGQPGDLLAKLERVRTLAALQRRLAAHALEFVGRRHTWPQVARSLTAWIRAAVDGRSNLAANAPLGPIVDARLMRIAS